MCVEDRVVDVNTDAVVAAEEAIVAAVGVVDVDVVVLDSDEERTRFMERSHHSQRLLEYHLLVCVCVCVNMASAVFQQ